MWTTGVLLVLTHCQITTRVVGDIQPETTAPPGFVTPGHAYRTCPPGKWGAQANCPEETIWRWIDRGFHGISWDFTENFSQLVLGTSWNYGFLLDFWKLALDSPWIPKDLVVRIDQEFSELEFGFEPPPEKYVTRKWS